MNSVKLVGITQPMLGRGPMCEANAEEFIAYCARVSNPANQDNPDSEKLLKYLVKHKHWSPFEMVHIVMEIETTRDIGRQILRHRSFSFQEFSQRYAEVDTDITILWPQDGAGCGFRELSGGAHPVGRAGRGGQVHAVAADRHGGKAQ